MLSALDHILPIKSRAYGCYLLQKTVRMVSIRISGRLDIQFKFHEKFWLQQHCRINSKINSLAGVSRYWNRIWGIDRGLHIKNISIRKKPQSKFGGDLIKGEDRAGQYFQRVGV